MRTANTHPGFSLKIVALALLAAFGSVAHAADDEIAALIRPDSSVSVGAAEAEATEARPLVMLASPKPLRATTLPLKTPISVCWSATRMTNSVPSTAALTNGVSTLSERGWRLKK